jgi:hypothetical protein
MATGCCECLALTERLCQNQVDCPAWCKSAPCSGYVMLPFIAVQAPRHILPDETFHQLGTVGFDERAQGASCCHNPRSMI